MLQSAGGKTSTSPRAFQGRIQLPFFNSVLLRQGLSQRRQETTPSPTDRQWLPEGCGKKELEAGSRFRRNEFGNPLVMSAMTCYGGNGINRVCLTFPNLGPKPSQISKWWELQRWVWIFRLPLGFSQPLAPPPPAREQTGRKWTSQGFETTHQGSQNLRERNPYKFD